MMILASPEFTEPRAKMMSDSEIEIVVDDPTAPEADSPAVTDVRVVDIAVSLLLIALAATLGYDNWRTGIGWDFDRPAGRLFPVLPVGDPGRRQPLWADRHLARQGGRGNLRHPRTAVAGHGGVRADAAVLPGHAFLGLYVASFLLISGFMRLVGRIALWKSLLTAFVFTAAMFVTFDIAFDVIMPKGPLEAAFGY